MYIGVFAMRYGSKPDGHDLSMTHLEYEEAQRLELPSLIYILDEKRQPILPQYVETGPGAEQLRRLKEFLCKRHTVSFFTTPDDLASRVLRDFPPVLQSIGAEMTGHLPEEPVADVNGVLRKFKLLPKRVAGTEIDIEFKAPDEWYPVDPETCVALRIAAGESIQCRITFDETSRRVYASGEVAEELIGVPEGEMIAVRARLAYGTGTHTEWNGNDGYFSEAVQYHGLVITHLKAPS